MAFFIPLMLAGGAGYLGYQYRDELKKGASQVLKGEGLPENIISPSTEVKVAPSEDDKSMEAQMENIGLKSDSVSNIEVIGEVNMPEYKDKDQRAIEKKKKKDLEQENKDLFPGYPWQRGDRNIFKVQEAINRRLSKKKALQNYLENKEEFDLQFELEAIDSKFQEEARKKNFNIENSIDTIDEEFDLSQPEKLLNWRFTPRRGDIQLRFPSMTRREALNAAKRIDDYMVRTGSKYPSPSIAKLDSLYRAMLEAKGDIGLIGSAVQKHYPEMVAIEKAKQYKDREDKLLGKENFNDEQLNAISTMKVAAKLGLHVIKGGALSGVGLIADSVPFIDEFLFNWIADTANTNTRNLEADYGLMEALNDETVYAPVNNFFTHMGNENVIMNFEDETIDISAAELEEGFTNAKSKDLLTGSIRFFVQNMGMSSMLIAPFAVQSRIYYTKLAKEAKDNIKAKRKISEDDITPAAIAAEMRLVQGVRMAEITDNSRTWLTRWISKEYANQKALFGGAPIKFLGDLAKTELGISLPQAMVQQYFFSEIDKTENEPFNLYAASLNLGGMVLGSVVAAKYFHKLPMVALAPITYPAGIATRTAGTAIEGFGKLLENNVNPFIQTKSLQEFMDWSAGKLQKVGRGAQGYSALDNLNKQQRNQLKKLGKKLIELSDKDPVLLERIQNSWSYMSKLHNDLVMTGVFTTKDVNFTIGQMMNIEALKLLELELQNTVKGGKKMSADQKFNFLAQVEVMHKVRNAMEVGVAQTLAKLDLIPEEKLTSNIDELKVDLNSKMQKQINHHDNVLNAADQLVKGIVFDMLENPRIIEENQDQFSEIIANHPSLINNIKGVIMPRVESLRQMSTQHRKNAINAFIITQTLRDQVHKNIQGNYTKSNIKFTEKGLEVINAEKATLNTIANAQEMKNLTGKNIVNVVHSVFRNTKQAFSAEYESIQKRLFELAKKTDRKDIDIEEIDVKDLLININNQTKSGGLSDYNKKILEELDTLSGTRFRLQYEDVIENIARQTKIKPNQLKARVNQIAFEDFKSGAKQGKPSITDQIFALDAVIKKIEEKTGVLIEGIEFKMPHDKVMDFQQVIRQATRDLPESNKSKLKTLQAVEQSIGDVLTNHIDQIRTVDSKLADDLASLDDRAFVEYYNRSRQSNLFSFVQNNTMMLKRNKPIKSESELDEAITIDGQNGIDTSSGLYFNKKINQKPVLDWFLNLDPDEMLMELQTAFGKPVVEKNGVIRYELPQGDHPNAPIFDAFVQLLDNHVIAKLSESADTAIREGKSTFTEKVLNIKTDKGWQGVLTQLIEGSDKGDFGLLYAGLTDEENIKLMRNINIISDKTGGRVFGLKPLKSVYTIVVDIAKSNKEMAKKLTNTLKGIMFEVDTITKGSNVRKMKQDYENILNTTKQSMAEYKNISTTTDFFQEFKKSLKDTGKKDADGESIFESTFIENARKAWVDSGKDGAVFDQRSAEMLTKGMLDDFTEHTGNYNFDIDPDKVSRATLKKNGIDSIHIQNLKVNQNVFGERNINLITDKKLDGRQFLEFFRNYKGGIKKYINPKSINALHVIAELMVVLGHKSSGSIESPARGLLTLSPKGLQSRVNAVAQDRQSPKYLLTEIAVVLMNMRSFDALSALMTAPREALDPLAKMIATGTVDSKDINPKVLQTAIAKMIAGSKPMMEAFAEHRAQLTDEEQEMNILFDMNPNMAPETLYPIQFPENMYRNPAVHPYPIAHGGGDPRLATENSVPEEHGEMYLRRKNYVREISNIYFNMKAKGNFDGSYNDMFKKSHELWKTKKMQQRPFKP